MSQTLLETLSIKQLSLFCLLLLAATSAFFIIGGTKGADPATANIHICNVFKVDEKYDFTNKSNWLWYNVNKGLKDNLDNGYVDKKFVDILKEGPTRPDHLILSTKLPHPGKSITMHREHQFMLVVMSIRLEKMFDSHYSKQNVSVENKHECTMEFNAKLGYSDSINPPDKADGWKLLDSVQGIRRPLSCKFDTLHDHNGHIDGVYTCEDQFLFELGSVSHKHYIINLQFPANGTNDRCLVTSNGHFLNEVHLVEIHQNGGYTISLFVSKTIMFPFVLIALLFFTRRIAREKREKVLIEKAAILLGVALLILVFPIDWFTLVADMPFMLFFSDLRQGLFYTALLIFWCIFAGEHILDQRERNNLGAYKVEVTCIVLSCLSLFIFDCVERGIQLGNAFHTIWKKDAGETAARIFLGFAMASAVVYFLFFLRLLYHVYSNIKLKEVALAAMQEDRRLFYENRIYRFRVLIWVTLLTVLLTVVCFIFDQVNETSWKFEDNSINEYIIVSSAMHFGMFGLWGAYVFAILILYSPSNSSNTGPDVQYRRSDHLLRAGDEEDDNEVSFQHPKPF